MKSIDLLVGNRGVARVVDLHGLSCSTIWFLLLFPKRDPDLLIDPLKHALRRQAPDPTWVLLLLGVKHASNDLGPLFPRPHQVFQCVRNDQLVVTVGA